jgi:hypothetical protein
LLKLSKPRVYVVDNASQSVSEAYRWNLAIQDLQLNDSLYDVIPISLNYLKFKKYHESNRIHLSTTLSSEISYHLKTTVTDNSIFLFANARDPLVTLLHEHRITYNKSFKIIGYWTDSVSFAQGNLRRKIKKSNYSWMVKYERCLADCFDVNLVGSKLLIKKLRTIYPAMLNFQQCGLPFDSTLKDITNDIDTLDIHKDDIVIMNTSPESIHDIKIFDALQQEMPQFQFININDRSLTQPEYQRLLARSKVVLSLNRTDTDPYTILESMALGSIPILPDLPLYSEMFNNEWLYSNISLKPPYLNFIRNREEIIQKIWNSVENYLNYNLQNEVQEITNTYYNSKDLKQILCKLIN